MRALTAAVLVALGLLAWVVWRVESTAAKVQEYIKELEEMQHCYTEWKDAKGVPHSVTTPRRDGESAEALAARHAEAVNALQAIYPPAP